MLMPFEWAVITVEEARILKKFIETVTATKAYPVNYKKIEESGMKIMYDKLSMFISEADHYAGQLKYFQEKDYDR
jgi:hypothetical protein